jgi:hypothetical protein
MESGRTRRVEDKRVREITELDGARLSKPHLLS